MHKTTLKSMEGRQIRSGIDASAAELMCVVMGRVPAFMG